MSKVCKITKKRPCTGNSYTIRGIAKKKKGIGLKVTGKTKRRFLPNLVRKRFWFEEESRFVNLRLSTAAIRLIEKKGLAHVIRQLRAEGEKV